MNKLSRTENLHNTEIEARLRHPYCDAFPALWGLLGLFGGTALIAAICSSWFNVTSLQIVAWSLGNFTLFWTLLIGYLWFTGLWQRRQAMQFLASDRPLLRWTYSPPEWQAIKATRRIKMQRARKMMLGSMVFMMSLTGGLEGVVIGLSRFGKGILGGLAGIVIGGIVGSVVGAIISAGGALAARRAYQVQEPEQVALGDREIYANNYYFKCEGNDRYIQGIRLQIIERVARLIVNVQNPKTLLLLPVIFNPTYTEHGRAGGTWEIIVPPRMIDEVEGVLPHITVSSKPS